MAYIPLPKPFGGLIQKHKNMFVLGAKNVRVIEAFMDENYVQGEIKSLRNWLGLKDEHPCCDLYCRIIVDGKNFNVLWEDKKGTHPTDGKNQLQRTYDSLKKKFPHEKVNFVVLSRAKYHKGFLTAKHSGEYGSKVLFAGPKEKIVMCGDEPIRALD